jgi:hypothetical protein
MSGAELSPVPSDGPDPVSPVAALFASLLSGAAL